MMIRSRVWLRPTLTRISAWAIALAPGPPAMYTTGSGLDGCATEGILATGRRIVWPLRFWRFSGTTSLPHSAPDSSGMEGRLVGHAPGSYLGTAATSGRLLEEPPRAPNAIARTIPSAKTVGLLQDVHRLVTSNSVASPFLRQVL